MRLVLDTNVVVSAVLGSSAPARLIELATEGVFDLFTSEPLLNELVEVLARGHVAKRLERKQRSASESEPRLVAWRNVGGPLQWEQSGPWDQLRGDYEADPFTRPKR